MIVGKINVQTCVGGFDLPSPFNIFRRPLADKGSPYYKRVLG
jgi:hypothetical protein